MLYNVFRIWIVMTFAAMLALSAGVGGREEKPENSRNRRDRETLELRRGESPERFDEPDKAAEFYLSKRTPDKDGIPVEKYLAAIEHIKRMPQYSTRLDRMFAPQTQMRPSEAQSLTLGMWTQLGPANIGGRTRALVINPSNPSIMYAAGVAGGIWKTTDAGASWSPLSDLLPNIAVSCLAINPQDPNVVYAGTGEGYYNIDAFRGAGILKTNDGGTTWAWIGVRDEFRVRYVNRIVVSPHDGNRIYAGTNNGIIRSTDAGASWLEIVAAQDCMDLAIRTDVPMDYLIASFGNFNHNQIWVISDAAGLAPSRISSFGETYGIGRTSIAIAPSNQNIVYALASEFYSALVDPTPPGPYQYGLHAVYRSTDGGLTWAARVRNTDPNKLNTLLLSNPLYAYLTECGLGTSQLLNQGWYDDVIAVDPVDANRVWAGGIDLFRSDDGGANWGLASYWWADHSAPQYAHADQHVIVFHPQYNGGGNQTMFVTGDGGIFKTNNARGSVATGSTAPCSPSSGVIWTSLNNNYAVTQFYNGAPYPSGATYFGGTQDNGTLRGATAGGLGWTSILGGDGGYVAVNPTNTNILFAENTGLSIKRSTNGGASFSPATTGITESPGNFLFIAPFAMNPQNPTQLLTGGSYVWQSLDGGASWSQATSFALSFGSAYSAFAFSPTNPNKAVAGLSSGSILLNDATLPPAFQWGGHYPWGSNSGFVSSMAFDPTNDNIVYWTFSTFSPGPDYYHVYRSTDFGISWRGIDGYGDTGIPDIPVHSIVIDRSNTARLYVGTDLGVFVSLDAGNTWARENTGFANVPTESLALNTVGGVTTLFAFTHGRGAWRVDLPAACSSVSPLAQSVPASGSLSNTVTVTATAGCGWTATSNDSWITIFGGGSGAGNGTVLYSVAPNTGSGIVFPRTGSLTVAGQTVTISQDGNLSGPCNFQITPSLQIMPAAGGHAVVTTYVSDSCSITRESVDESWIRIATGFGAQMFYSVDQNPGTTPRTASIRFRDNVTNTIVATVTVLQDGAGCATSISSRSQSFPASGGVGSVSVSAPNSCAWTASPIDSFITITSGSSGAGNGSLSYSVAANPFSLPRSGSMLISGQVFTVTQPGAVAVGLGSFKTDFDSDGKSDIGFYRAGLWGFLKSAQSFGLGSAQFFSWGASGAQPICADFDGDGKADIAYLVPPSGGQSAAYAILQSTRNYSFAPGDVLFVPAGFPVLGDTPVVGDFDGDGKADPGIWRASQGVWIIPKSSTNYTSYIFSQWGQDGDIPVIADFDMDGKADIGFYRDGLWGVLKSSQNYSLGSAQFFSWGGAGLQPIVGDFDGDGKADIGYLVPPTNGQSAVYAILKSSTGYSFLPGDVLFVAAGYPILGDTPVVGDFDGDGKDDPGIWRESQGIWILPRSSTNYTTFIFSQWGQSGDIPFPNSTGKH